MLRKLNSAKNAGATFGALSVAERDRLAHYRYNDNTATVRQAKGEDRSKYVQARNKRTQAAAKKGYYGRP